MSPVLEVPHVGQIADPDWNVVEDRNRELHLHMNRKESFLLPLCGERKRANEEIVSVHVLCACAVREVNQ